jgi:hypothetical protein
MARRRRECASRCCKVRDFGAFIRPHGDRCGRRAVHNCEGHRTTGNAGAKSVIGMSLALVGRHDVRVSAHSEPQLQDRAPRADTSTGLAEIHHVPPHGRALDAPAIEAWSPGPALRRVRPHVSRLGDRPHVALTCGDQRARRTAGGRSSLSDADNRRLVFISARRSCPCRAEL